MRRLLFAVLLVVPAFAAFAQDKPRLAIIPLNYIEVPKSAAFALTGLLETGLVNTDMYNVIEQTQVDEILEAQEYSLSDCTDEQCAIEFGKLLAAEQIVLGAVSRIGGKYVITAKVIDVTTGTNIKADTVEATSLDDLTTQVNLLAYMLAGLTYREGGEAQIAKAFGEVFVMTEPDEAEVFVNGVKKGTSPLVVSKVPLGTVLIEAKKGNMYEQAEVQVKADDLAEIELVLKISLGRLFIKSSEKAVDVYLAGENLGELATGLFKDIPAGEYDVVLQGADVYWQGDVRIEAGKTTTVDAYPVGVGSMRYSLPEGVKAEIQGRNFRQVVQGSGTLQNLPQGEYRVEATGINYRIYSAAVSVTRGVATQLRPQLQYTEEYQAEVARREQEAEYEKLSVAVKRLEQLAAKVRPTQTDVETAALIDDQVAYSKYSSPEMREKANQLARQVVAKKKEADRAEEIASLSEEKVRLDIEIESATQSSSSAAISGSVFTVGGLASLVATLVCVWFRDQPYEAYRSTPYTEVAVAKREEAEMWSAAIIGTGIGAAVSLPLGLLTFATGADPEPLQKRLQDVEKRLRALGGSE